MSARHLARKLACAIDDEAGEIWTLRVSPTTEAIVAWVGSLSVAVAYEAGPTGFGLARALTAVRGGGAVGAGAPAGSRVTTDRRNAERLTGFFGSGSCRWCGCPSRPSQIDLGRPPGIWFGPAEDAWGSAAGPTPAV